MVKQFCYFAACCFFSVTGARADSLQPVYDVLGAIGVARNGVYVDAKDERLQQNTPVQVSFQGSFGANMGAYFALSEPGVVRIYAQSWGQPDNATDTQAFAYFADYLTVSGAPENSFLQITFSVDGTGNDNYDGIRSNPRSAFLLQDTLTMNGQICSPVLNTSISTDVSGSCQLVAPVADGQPIQFILQLQGDAENRSGDSSVLDFSHTGRITSIELLDAAGSRLPDSLISTASGFTYPGPAVSTPEPISILLLGLGSSVLGVVHRRKRTCK